MAPEWLWPALVEGSQSSPRWKTIKSHALMAPPADPRRACVTLHLGPVIPALAGLFFDYPSGRRRLIRGAGVVKET